METRKFYISNINNPSGISVYSRDFFQLVLKERNYVLLDSQRSTSDILSLISFNDLVHIEIGIFQHNELRILFDLIGRGYKNITVTMHDPPLLKYPFHHFHQPFANNLSKFYDRYINRFQKAGSYLKKINTIYVLTRKGLQEMKTKYALDNVYYLPHIVDDSEILPQSDNNLNTNFIYFGFIGRNKNIEYALQLHQEILKEHPSSLFYVAGTALGKEKKFLGYLKAKYKNNVQYLGYVEESNLNDLFQKANFSVLLFKDYKFYSPFSGSILYNLKKGKIVFTNRANAITETIENLKNGIYLTGNLSKDVKLISEILCNKELQKQIQNNIPLHLTQNHSKEIVSNYLLDD